MFITIFTPTYNRAYRISTLYQSLCRQTFNDFEWLIVDDGSSDDTEEVIRSLADEKKIQIRYFKQVNKGKHIAFNYGVQEAKGTLFWCVDSDDFIADDAIEWLHNKYQEIKGFDDFVGISGEKYDYDSKPVANKPPFEQIDSNALDVIFRYRILGDLSEVFRTEILKQYPFPETPGEKFCAESLVWNRIAQKYKIRYYFNKAIYYCEYLKDGLSAHSIKLRLAAPTNTLTLYAELSTYDIPFFYKLRSCINFWRFMHWKNIKLVKQLKMIKMSSLLMAPLGVMMKISDQRKI